MKHTRILYLVLFLLAVNIALVTTQIIGAKKERSVKYEHKHELRPPHRGERGRGFEHVLSKELGLSKSQKDELARIGRGFHEEKKRIRREIHDLRKQYFSALSIPEPDTALLEEIAKELGKIEAEKIKMEYNHYRNIRAVCSEEQALKMDSLSREHMHRRFRHMPH